MPFTLAHAAAALPFRRLPLVPSAVVVGTLAPDFEYFLRLAPQGGFGQSFAGALLLSLPLALLALWLFQALVRGPLVQLFPDAIRLRLRQSDRRFRFGGPARFLLLAVSALIGIATHIAWDSFTHHNAWPVRHWALLRQLLYLPVVGPVPCYKILQHASTVTGLLVLCVWAIHWYSRTPPQVDPESPGIPAARRRAILGSIAGVALVGGLARAAIAIASWGFGHARERVIGDGVVTALALAWWTLVVYAAVIATRRTSGAPV